MARYPQTVLVSCEIPWDDHEQLMEEVFRREIRVTLERGFNYLYIFGTAGEGYAVDTARFRQIVQVFEEETRGDDVHPMVGVITLSTANTIERVGLAHDAGFRTFQVVLPSWGTVSDVEMLTYFNDVCGTFPDSQFLHYNLPRAGRVLGGAEYRRLIDAVPNLVATKTTSGGLPRAADLMLHASELQHFFGEANFPHGCMYGECSLLSSLAPMMPQKTWAFFEAGRTRQMDRLFQMQHDLHTLLVDVFGPLPPGERIDGAYDKMIQRFGGLEEMPLRLLSPYQCYTEEQYQACKRVFDARYAEWAAS
jgi:dihydrodipicolinate synthase/N-acetylneuraminate lyase